MLRVAILVSLFAGCVTPANRFECSTSSECSGGTCEPDGLCSFADAACPSGRRYGESSGPKAGQCVEGVAACGNGVVEGDEECDDGNSATTDLCIDCKTARCGDGQIAAGVEECDDGNTDDGDACNANCLMCGTGSVTDPATGHCYRLVETAQDWNDAADDCIASGGYLASINSATENAFVTALLVDAQYWIGLEDSFGGTMRWQDDDRLGSFTAWAMNEPSDGMNDDCVGLLAAGTWDRQPCNGDRPYVCEREPPFVEPTTKHIYRRFTGRNEVSYAEAIAACAALVPTAHLVTITDQAEQNFVDSITGANRIWIGLDDRTTEGTFVWITGETSTFFAWNVAEMEPDAANAMAEDGVALQEDGTWQTREITGMFADDPYICEIDP